MSDHKFKVGDKVQLGEHTTTPTSTHPLHKLTNFSKNWAPTMYKYVGKITSISSLAGQDSASNLYFVDIDGCSHFWREINMILIEDQVVKSKDGCNCDKCNAYMPYAELPATGKFRCYSCKNRV